MVSGPNAAANRTAGTSPCWPAAPSGLITWRLRPTASAPAIWGFFPTPARPRCHWRRAGRERLERLWGGKLPVDTGMGYDDMLDAAAAAG